MVLGFACNMRKHFNLGEEAIGNILHFPYFKPIKAEFVRQATLIQLAEISRINVSGLSVNDYIDKLAWFKQFYQFKENATHYVPLPYVDDLYWGHTNWASFNYQDIAFDDNKPQALVTPPFPPQLKFTVTLVDFRNQQKPLLVPMNLDAEHITLVKVLANELQLFELFISEDDN